MAYCIICGGYHDITTSVGCPKWEISSRDAVPGEAVPLLNPAVAVVRSALNEANLENMEARIVQLENDYTSLLASVVDGLRNEKLWELYIVALQKLSQSNIFQWEDNTSDMALTMAKTALSTWKKECGKG